MSQLVFSPAACGRLSLCVCVCSFPQFPAELLEFVITLPYLSTIVRLVDVRKTLAAAMFIYRQSSRGTVLSTRIFHILHGVNWDLIGISTSVAKISSEKTNKHTMCVWILTPSSVLFMIFLIYFISHSERLREDIFTVTPSMSRVQISALPYGVLSSPCSGLSMMKQQDIGNWPKCTIA